MKQIRSLFMLLLAFTAMSIFSPAASATTTSCSTIPYVDNYCRTGAIHANTTTHSLNISYSASYSCRFKLFDAASGQVVWQTEPYGTYGYKFTTIKFYSSYSSSKTYKVSAYGYSNTSNCFISEDNVKW